MILPFIVILLVIDMALFHEIGHLYYFKRYLKKKVTMFIKWNLKIIPTFIIGSSKDYKDLTHVQALNVYQSGIAFGFIPFIIIVLLYGWGVIYALPLYMAGCISDFKEILKEVKRYNDSC